MPNVNKTQLKTVFLRKRKTLTEEEYDRRNAKLFYLFSQLLDEKAPMVVHTFLPIIKQKEVDTWIMIKYLKALSIKIVVSKMSTSGNDLEHFIFDKAQLKENTWGISEPLGGENIAEDQIDMVLVPMVIFDQKGHRVGYGKGYYDKFLAQCRPDCVKVGLSLLPPLDEIPYIESHDVALDYCLSPVGIHRFKK